MPLTFSLLTLLHRFFVIALLNLVSALEYSLPRAAQCTLALSPDINPSTITGYATPGGACRYTIRYASTAERWGYSWIATDLSNQTFSQLPPACPQAKGSYVDGESQSEDCLFATVYVPPTASSKNPVLPVFIWIHGGSFTSGSASAPGLDGSKLAVNGNMIVVVLQYRLGVLGFLPPSLAPSSGDPNLGLLDLINGLKAVNQYASLVGGDKGKVTVGGQSSGAGMLRALWGAPQAKGLFRAAILQSDPMTYGFASPSVTSQLRQAHYSQAPLSGCSTLECLQSIPLDHLLSVQTQVSSWAPFDIPGLNVAEVFRPTFGTTTLPSDPTVQLFSSPASLAIPPRTLLLLITTLKNEGGTITSQLFPTPVPSLTDAVLLQTLASLQGEERAAKLVSSGLYTLGNTSATSEAGGGDGDGVRERFEKLVTDGVWRCPNRDVARQWAKSGGNVWVGEWRQGVTYPDNAAFEYCTAPGRVCHEDDIFPTFGTAPSPMDNTTSFEDEIMSRWISFITTLDPNPTSPSSSSSSSSSRHLRSRCLLSSGWKEGSEDGFLPGHAQIGGSYAVEVEKRWEKFTADSADEGLMPLGGDGEVGECPAGLWGETVKYDWQLYGCECSF